jgi:hypothetical protein
VNLFLSKRIIVFFAVMSALVLCAGRTSAMEISGTISSTLTIYDNSELTGDVICTVMPTMAGSNPCIAFGADHITLRLNGHTITGPVTPPTGCSLPSDSMFGVGIAAIDRTDVKLEGPGIVRHFHRWGILIGLTGHPSSRVAVKGMTADHNCWSGMQTFATTDSTFEKNTFVDDAGGSNGASCGGT